MKEKFIIELIKKDSWRMDILRAVRSLYLPDWLIGAGFVRNPVWDYLHGYKKQTPISDIDVAYFDPNNLQEETEKQYEKKLQALMPAQWSVINQARMAKINHEKRDYISTEDAIAHWPETATAIGLRLLDDDALELIAPHGIEDLFSLKLRKTPEFSDGYDGFLKRLERKEWLKKWPKLEIVFQ